MNLQENKSYKIGLLALCSFIILYYGFLFLKGYNIFSKHNDYRVSYPTNQKLIVSSPVKLKGHIIGNITNIEILPEQNYSTLVTIAVDKRFPLTDKSKVMLTNAGIMEGNSLELELHGGKPLTKNDIIVGQYHPEFSEIDLNALSAQVATVTANLIKTSEGVNAILGNLEKTSYALNSAIDTIQHHITTVTQDIATISKPLADLENGIPAMMPVVHRILTAIETVPFKDTSLKLIRIINNMEGWVNHTNRGKGTLGLLIHDTALYDNLNNSAAHLNSLLFDIRKRPSYYCNVHFSLWGGRPANVHNGNNIDKQKK
ncbi:MlaD family protein [Candidatus Cardinium hertigii]|jgi:phospholipid/cholesterol/gamma-HCH transport system substrate-binding protein|uniref:MCE family protein n=1 Tax=Candidatus Cardinium hertigii TaxID=247481 RepID=A0A3N2QBJ5_9BACT|nr:MlaD family protein [Candidatus Cardinium hertigii]ROT46942.1 MCE family protein [Candidatus Cardinium hertigii]